MGRSSEELLQIPIGDDSSLDIIKMEDMSVLFVVSERGDIQRRTVVKVEKNDALEIVKFIMDIHPK